MTRYLRPLIYALWGLVLLAAARDGGPAPAATAVADRWLYAAFGLGYVWWAWSKWPKEKL